MGLAASAPSGAAGIWCGAATGSLHTVLLRNDGQALAFGHNYVGQCKVPALPAGGAYVAAACGRTHTILLRSDGQAVLFGYLWYDGNTVPPLPAGETYVKAAHGGKHAILLRSDGQAVAFGCNRNGQCEVPALPAGETYVAAAGGDEHTVLVRSDGRAVAFGYKYDGQCEVPALPAGETYVAAACGRRHTILLRSDGQAVAFGKNQHGQCVVPALPAGETYVAAAGGRKHTVLLRSDGQAVAFGCNRNGQCNVPALTAGERYVVAAGGDEHTVLLRSDGRAAVAFGHNGQGQCKVPAALDIVPPARLHVRWEDADPYTQTVFRLAQRSISVDRLLHFYHELFKRTFRMPDAGTTTKEVVKDIIIPITADQGSSWVEARAKDDAPFDQVVHVVHSWGMSFVDLIVAILNDASGGQHQELGKSYEKSRAIYSSVLRKRYWVCCFCINQHRTVCKENPYQCNCSTPLFEDTMPECELNKFDEVAAQLRLNRNGRMIVALDKEMQALQRAWCVDEVHYALDTDMDIRLSFSSFPGIPEMRSYSCDVASCHARQNDKERILAKVRGGTGETRFNRRVTQFVTNYADELVHMGRERA